MALNSSNFQILVAATLDAANIQKQLDTISKRYKTIKINLDVDTTSLNNATNSLNNCKQSITETGKAAQGTSQSIGDIVSKVTKFGAATLIINKFRQAIVDGYGAVKELDASVTEYRKVSELTDSQMGGFIDNARELGLTVARTADEMVEAATEFKKMGNDDSTSLELGRLATMFQNIADESVSAGDSASFINSQMKAFNFTANEAIHVLDAVNEVANNFAVSSGDISIALPKVASTMALAGNSFEETIGLLTAGAELIPNQASRIARGLRSITLNLQGLNEDGEQVAGMAASMQEEFDKLGISLLDEQGQIKSTYEIFSELAEIFPKLDKNTQTYYASLIGGKTQVDVVTAILKNFETALNATDTALNSVGSAMEENEKYMGSIQGKIAALNSEFQKFWTEGISSNSVKRIVEFGTGILKLVNDLGGLPTILTAVVGIIATLKGYSLVNYITKITKSITSTIGVIKGLQAEGFTLINVFNGMTSAATKFQIAAGALTLIITAIVGKMASLKQKQEEARNAALQAGEAFNSQAQDLNNLLEKYNDIWDSEGEKAKQLAELRKTLATQYGLEKDALDNLNGSREAGNKLLNDEIQKRAESTYAQYLSEIQKAQEYLTRTDFSVTLPITIDENTFKDETRNKINQIFGEMAVEFNNGVIAFQGGSEKLKNAMEQAIIYLSRLKEPTENESLLLASLQYDLTKVAEGYNDNTEVIQKYAEVIARNTPEVTKFINGQYETKEAMEEAKKVALNSVGPFKEIKTAIENLANIAFPEFIVSQEETTTGMHNQKDEADEIAKTLKELSDELLGVQGAYDTLSEVAKEYNETGSLTVTTLANLLKLNPEYLQALSMENGQLIVNTDMLNQMARGYDTSAYKALTGVTGISAFGNALKGTTTAGETVAQRIAEVGNAAITAGQKAFEGAKGFKSLIGSIAAFAGTLKAGISGDKGDGTRDYGHGFDSQVAAYQENERKKFFEDLIAKMHIDTSGGSKKGGGGGGKDSAEKAAKEAAKEAAKAYKEEFEKRISEIKFKFDMGDVTELGYWKEVDKIVQEFYANNEAYAEEYRDWTAKIQKGMVSGTKANFELERDALDHKLAMDLISQETYYRELEKLRQKYYAQDPIYAAQSEDIEEEIYAFKKKKLKDLAEERKRQRKKEWDEETDWLNEQKSRYETAFNYIDSLAQKEIDSLEEQKKAIEDKYNAEIDKINEAQDALNDEIELQEKLEALAKAQNTKIRVYREGVGFVYENDQSAVDEAKAALTQYQKEQDTKKEIKRLEDIRDATIESVEEQIKYWEKYRDEWKDMVNSYTEQQNKLIAEQVLGISLEGENWEKRLGNLQDYVDRYNSILSQLKHRGDYDDYDDDDYDYGTGGGGGSAGGGGTIGPGDHAGSGGHWDSSDSSHGPGVAANGTTTGHGLTMVGEKGRELRVLGSGTNEGDGIVPNHLTENLMKLEQYSPREWINAITHNPGNQQNSTQYSYVFDSLVLPNVTNADSFISELKNIKNQAIQMGGKRS